MKPPPSRARPLVQPDLFDSAAAPRPLTSLQLHHNELVDLLSQLLWRVASPAASAHPLENDDEQDKS